MQINFMEDYRWGIDYLLSILSAIPFNSGMAPSNSQWVKEYIAPNTVAGIGFFGNCRILPKFFLDRYNSRIHFLGNLMGKYWSLLRNKMLTTIDLSMILIVFFIL